jgi:hypothetical protein
VIRRRFEINDGIVGWGQGAFAAVPPPRRHAARLAWAAPGAGPGGLRRARRGRPARHPARQLGSGSDRCGRLGAEPDRRHRVVAVRAQSSRTAPDRSGCAWSRSPRSTKVAAWSSEPSRRFVARHHRSRSSHDGHCGRATHGRWVHGCLGRSRAVFRRGRRRRRWQDDARTR